MYAQTPGDALPKSHFANRCEDLESELQRQETLASVLSDRLQSRDYLLAKIIRQLNPEWATLYGSYGDGESLDDSEFISRLVEHHGEDGVIEELLGLAPGVVMVDSILMQKSENPDRLTEKANG